MKFRDYYEILGVPRSASREEIRKAFRKLARTHHPDVAEIKEGAEERFKEINEAYEVLGDDEKRKKYDALGEHWRAGEGFTPPPPADGGFGGWEQAAGGDDYHFEGTGFSDFFEKYFGGRPSHGGFAGYGARPTDRSVPRRGRDIESEVLVSIDEAMHGAERTVVIQPQRPGQPEERRTVTIRIPKGVTDNQTIRAAGVGEPGTHGADAGDLYLRVRLERHPDFRIEGHQVFSDLSLAPWEAVLGATVEVRTPHGPTRIKIPPGAEPGTEFRIQGKGLPKGKSGSFGDFFAVVRVVLPTRVTDEEKRRWQALADISTFNPR